MSSLSAIVPIARERRTRPFDDTSPGLLTLPERVAIADMDHPDRIDWREVRLAIDLVEGRWQHVLLESKPDGRSSSDLLQCPIFESAVGLLLTRLYDHVWPDRDNNMLRFPNNVPRQKMFHCIRAGTTIMSFHGCAQSQKALMDMSRHEHLRLVSSWSELSRQYAARRDAPAR